MEPKEFGEYLRKTRREKNITLVNLGKEIGLTDGYLSMIENGKKGIPKPATLNKIAKGLGIPNGTLMMMAGHIDDAFDHAYKMVGDNLVKADLEDIGFLLNNKTNVYYNGKQLSQQDRELALSVLDKLFKE